MKIQIVTIATGTYKCFFDNFVNTLPYFFPNVEKKLSLLTDDIKYFIEKKFPVNIEITHIFDLIYPCININKPLFVNNVLDKTCDYVFYFDIDTIFLKRENYNWDEIIKNANEEKVILTFHPFYQMKEEATIWDVYKEDVIKNLYTSNLTEKDNRFAGYIEDNEYMYINSAFFGGSLKRIRIFNERLIEMARRDLTRHINSRGYHIPNYIDENYVNRLYNDYVHKRNDALKFNAAPYSVLYDIESYMPDTVFMQQKNMYGEKENRR